MLACGRRVYIILTKTPDVYNKWFSHISKSLQNDISFSLKVQMVLVRMNLNPSLPAYRLIST